MYIFLCKIVSQVATYITSLYIQFLLKVIQICLQMKEILNVKIPTDQISWHVLMTVIILYSIYYSHLFSYSGYMFWREIIAKFCLYSHDEFWTSTIGKLNIKEASIDGFLLLAT